MREEQPHIRHIDPVLAVDIACARIDGIPGRIEYVIQEQAHVHDVYIAAAIDIAASGYWERGSCEIEPCTIDCVCADVECPFDCAVIRIRDLWLY